MQGAAGLARNDGAVNSGWMVRAVMIRIFNWLISFNFFYSQKDYICFDFVPQHHNVIRYRRGIAVIKDDFSTVCSWVQFQNKVKWKYDLYLKKNPVPIKCPVAGKFNFTQRGEVPFETRILGGVTLSPRPNTYCKQNISDFSVCDTEQKEIAIDENYCLTVDHLGRPVDIYSKQFVWEKINKITLGFVFQVIPITE